VIVSAGTDRGSVVFVGLSSVSLRGRRNSGSSGPFPPRNARFSPGLPIWRGLRTLGGPGITAAVQVAGDGDRGSRSLIPNRDVFASRSTHGLLTG